MIAMTIASASTFGMRDCNHFCVGRQRYDEEGTGHRCKYRARDIDDTKNGYRGDGTCGRKQQLVRP